MKKIIQGSWPIISLLLLATVYFYRIIFCGKIFLFGDAYYYYSIRALISWPLKNFSLPFWTQYLNCGYPLIADPEAGFFDPLNILCLFLFGAARGFNYLICAYFFLAGVSMFFYCRCLGLGRPPALFAAVVFSFGGAFLGRLVHPGMIFSASFLPLAFWMIELFFLKRQVKYLFLTGLSLGAAFLPGHPQIAVYVASASSLYFLFRALPEIKQGNFQNALKYLALLGLILTVAAGISAVQNIPTFEFTKLSNRAGGLSYSQARGISLAPKHFITYIFPYFFGSDTVVGTMPYRGKGSFWELHVYLGILPLLFVFAGMFSFKKDRRYRFFFFLSLLALLLALGKNTPVFFIFYKTLPFLRYFKDPCRFVFISSFAMAVLSALGMSRLMSDRRFLERFSKVTARVFVFFIFTLTLVNCLFYFAFAGDFRKLNKACQGLMRGYNLGDLYVQLPLLLLGSGIILLFLLARKKVNQRQFAVAAVMIAFLDLLSINCAQNIPLDIAVVSVAPQSVELLKKDKGLFRVFNVGADFPYGSQRHREKMKTPFYILWAVESANITGPLYLGGYINNLMSIEEAFRTNPDFAIDKELPFLSRLNVKYITSSWKLNTQRMKLLLDDGVVKVYQNPDPLPRSFFISADKTLRQTGPEDIMPGSAVEVSEYKNNRVILAVRAPAPGFLILNDTDYPGWKVFVDGRPGQILKANSTMRAVVVESGRHTVEFIYRLPLALKWGFFISLFSLAAVAGICFLPQRKSLI